MSYAEIWNTLSKVDVSAHIEKKGRLDYLSWANAWSMLMAHYPQAEFRIHKEKRRGDETVECRVTVTIDECSRTMWLPVMDNKNNAVQAPDMRQISDTRMRCLVKCLSLFGLGISLYSGEIAVPEAPATVSDAQQGDLQKLYADLNEQNQGKFMSWLYGKRIKQLEEVPADAYDAVLGVLHKAYSQQYAQEQALSAQALGEA